MATLHITSCKVGFHAFGISVPAADGETFVTEALTTSASNAQSAAVTHNFVRLVSDAAHYIAIGSNPDATTATARIYLPANVVEYFQIEKGNKVAAVTA